MIKQIVDIGRVLKARDIRLAEEQATISNLSTTVVFHRIGDMSDEKTVDFKLFSKTRNFNIADTGKFRDFPGIPDATATVELDPEVFAESFLDYVPYVSADKSRETLTGVGVCAEFTCATDGLVLKLDKARTSSVPFILREETVRVLDILLKAGEAVTRASIGDETHLRIRTQTVSVYTKLIPGPYPNALNCIPDIEEQEGVVLNNEQLDELRVAVDALRDYAGGENNFCILGGSCIYAVESKVYAQLPFVINSRPYLIGVNQRKFALVLEDMRSADMRLSSAIRGITFHPEGTQEVRLMMPLRIKKLPNFAEYKLLDTRYTAPVVQESNYYLMKCDTLYGITENASLPGVVWRLTTKDYNALRALGVKELTV